MKIIKVSMKELEKFNQFKKETTLNEKSIINEKTNIDIETVLSNVDVLKEKISKLEKRVEDLETINRKNFIKNL